MQNSSETFLRNNPADDITALSKNYRVVKRMHYAIPEKRNVFLKQDAWVPDCLICKICEGLLEEPHRTKCGYSFCLKCIENKSQEISQKKTTRKTQGRKNSGSCGFCETKETKCFDQAFCVKNFILCEIIDQINVICPLCEQGFEFSSLDSHQKNCKGLLQTHKESTVLQPSLRQNVDSLKTTSIGKDKPTEIYEPAEKPSLKRTLENPFF